MQIEGSVRGASPAPFSSLPRMLEHQAARIPEAPAMLAVGRAPLSYRRLHQHVDAIGGALRSMRIRGDGPVVLPNGPELPVAIIAVTACAACAPVNPVFGTEELERYFADLRPRAVITQAASDLPARHAARACDLQVIELSTSADMEAGLFALAGDRGSARGPTNRPAAATWHFSCPPRVPDHRSSVREVGPT